MRILVLTALYPPHHLGGYELTCRDAVERWRRSGVEVSVLTSSSQFETSMDEADREVGVERTLQWYEEDEKWHTQPARDRRRAVSHNVGRLRAALVEFNPTVVSVWATGGFMMPMLHHLDRKDFPVTLIVSADWLREGPAQNLLDRAAWRSSTVAFILGKLWGYEAGRPKALTSWTACFASEHTRDRAGRDPRLREMVRRSQVIHPGVDNDSFTLRDREPDWRFRLLFVGRHDPDKGPAVAIRSLLYLPECATLTLCGRGSEAMTTYLEKLAESLGLAERVRFMFVTRDELATLYQQSDVVVFPSRTEAFGLVPLEAMASGTPVVTTVVGGLREFASPGLNCLEIAPDSPKQLAAQVLELAASKALRATLTEGGAKTALRFSDAETADRLLATHRAAAERISPTAASASWGE